MSKIAQEAVARTCARLYDLPVTIARMNASYGPNGGLPVYHLDCDRGGQRVTDALGSVPVHADPRGRHQPPDRRAARCRDACPPRIVNWGGDEAVTVQEWSAFFAELTGHDVPVDVVETPGTLRGSIADPTARQAVAGPCTVSWHDGLRGTRTRRGTRERARHRRVVGHRCRHRARVRRARRDRRHLRAPRGPARRGAGRSAPAAEAWVVDLADLDGIDAFAAQADDEMGGIDVLVNNAGIPKRRRTTTMTADDAESVMAINYFSPVRLTLARAAAA